MLRRDGSNPITCLYIKKEGRKKHRRPLRKLGAVIDGPSFQEDIMNMKNWWNESLKVWQRVLIIVLAVVILIIGTLLVNSWIGNGKPNFFSSKPVPVATEPAKTYEQVTLVVEAPKDFLRIYFGYDGANSEGYQPLAVDEQRDNRRTGKVSLVVPTGYDLLLNARVDMGPNTKFGFLSDPKNVMNVSVMVKETGKRIGMSEKDLVLRKTGDSKVPTPILRFAVTPEGDVQSVVTQAQAAETATPSAQSDVIVVGPPPAKK